MRKKITVLAGVLLALTASFSNLKSNSTGSPGDYSGFTSSNCTSCHNSNTLNSGSGVITVKIFNDQGSEITTKEYRAGKKYKIQVEGSKTGISTFGFCASVKEGQTNNGTISTPSNNAKVVNSYVTHKSTGSKTFTFEWTAPANATKDVKLYVAYNLADGNTGSDGDFIYTETIDWKLNTTAVEENNFLTQNTKLISNPVNNEVRIQFNALVNSPLSLKVMNLMGQVLKSVDMPRISQGQTMQLDVNEIPSGVYVISAISEGQTASFKMLKN